MHGVMTKPRIMTDTRTYLQLEVLLNVCIDGIYRIDMYGMQSMVLAHL